MIDKMPQPSAGGFMIEICFDNGGNASLYRFFNYHFEAGF